MRVLVTGASGFAGGWLCRACADAGDAVTGVSRTGTASEGAAGIALDLCDADATSRLVGDVAPEVVYHLAALSSVGRSWEQPTETLSANIGAALSLLEAVRTRAPGARVVWASSSEVYGRAPLLPTPEDAPLAPANPYAVSKCAAEQLAAVYRDAHKLDLVIARPFSHSGPGQLPVFLMASICRQAAAARVAGERHARIVTGNAETRRDFTDVRDVAHAYRLLARSATREVFNVCSGASVSAAEQVAAVGALLDPIEVEHVVDPALVRGTEVMELRGDASRLRAQTGWAPEIPYARTLADTLAFWERSLTAA